MAGRKDTGGAGVSVVIPTYNERGNIGPLIRRLEASLDGLDFEIVVVDDASPDGTGDAVRAISAEDARVRLVSRKAKSGLTGAVSAGVRAAEGRDVVVMDADLSHPPEKARELAAALAAADIVVGSRLAKGGGVERWPVHRRLISKGADMLARIVLGVRCSDPLSGFFGVRRDVFMRTRLRTKGYKLLLNLLYDNRGLGMKEIPYVFRDRAEGKTKLGYGEIFTYVLDILRIRFG